MAAAEYIVLTREDLLGRATLLTTHKPEVNFGNDALHGPQATVELGLKKMMKKNEEKGKTTPVSTPTE